jgi:hypothetical protein
MIGGVVPATMMSTPTELHASQAVDNARRSMYDPEMDDEQRERQLRKRLNQAFKERASCRCRC